jgi:tetratricopeptide (TPR) repeat protein
MAKRITEKKHDGLSSIVLMFLFILCSTSVHASLQSQQIAQAEFSKELREAYSKNDGQQAASLIKDHRLFVKPFVNDLITESISKELKGKATEAGQTRTIAEKTAATFENTFGEKSLTIGVNYLKTWSKEQKRKKLVADSLYALGTTIRTNAQERERAIVVHQQALDLYKEIGDERGEAEVLGGLGLICNFKNDNKKAISYYQQALIKREKVDDRLLIGNTVNSMGSIYYGIFKDYRIALPYFDRAESIRTELGDSLNLGRTILLKASTLDNLGQFEPALKYYKRARELNQVSGDQARVAESLLKAGTVLNNLDRYPEALESLNKALEINKAINKSSGISEALNQIGYVYLKLGDLNKALDKFNEAIKITKDQNDKWGLAGIYNNLGIMLQDAGRIEKALEYYNNALSIFEELGDQASVLILLGNIGTINFDLKDYAKAEEYHLKGLKISRDLNSKDQEAKNLLNLANSQVFLGKFDEAMSNYNTGLKIAQSLNSPELIWKITAGLAETWERQGNYEKAVELNDTVLKIIEGMRTTLESDEQKSSFMASERYVFEDVINLLSMLHEKDRTKGYDKLAFQYTEQSKSRAFLDLLAESLANVKEGENNELLKKQDEILTGLTQVKKLLEQESKAEKPDQQKISVLKEKIKTSEEELDKVQQEIRKTNPRYADLHYPQPVSLEEVKALCPDKNTVILEYSVGDSSSCLWVITQSAHKLFRLPDRKALQEQIESFRFALLNPDQTKQI